jgi:hypothetical protein
VAEEKKSEGAALPVKPTKKEDSEGTKESIFDGKYMDSEEERKAYLRLREKILSGDVRLPKASDDPEEKSYVMAEEYEGRKAKVDSPKSLKDLKTLAADEIDRQHRARSYAERRAFETKLEQMEKESKSKKKD